jgi:hypothetical protein
MARQRIQLRRDTASSWADVDPVLLDGEFGLESDTRLLKIGDGTTAWNDLDYFIGGIDTLAELSDVDVLTAVDGSVLTYDEATAKFVANPLNTKLTIADGGNF